MHQTGRIINFYFVQLAYAGNGHKVSTVVTPNNGLIEGNYEIWFIQLSSSLETKRKINHKNQLVQSQCTKAPNFMLMELMKLLRLLIF